MIQEAGFDLPPPCRPRSAREGRMLCLTRTPTNSSELDSLVRKHPDVQKIVLSVKLRPPPQKSADFEDFLLVCTVFPHFDPFYGGGINPNFAECMDTQTILSGHRDALQFREESSRA